MPFPDNLIDKRDKRVGFKAKCFCNLSCKWNALSWDFQRPDSPHFPETRRHLKNKAFWHNEKKANLKFEIRNCFLLENFCFFVFSFAVCVQFKFAVKLKIQKEKWNFLSITKNNGTSQHEKKHVVMNFCLNEPAFYESCQFFAFHWMNERILILILSSLHAALCS